MGLTVIPSGSPVGPVHTKALTVLLVVGSLLCLLLNLGVAQDAFANPGDLDQAFGIAGIVMVDLTAGGGFSSSVAVQPDGKIVVGGGCFTDAATSTDFCLARYQNGGSLDMAFGVGGRVSTAFIGASVDTVNALALQKDEKIIAVGQSGMSFALARYHTDGTLDPTFGTGGRVITSFGSFFDIPRGVAVQPDGKIVVVGSSSSGLFLPAKFAVARYTAEGSLDATFGNGGKVTTNFGIDTSDGATSVALQSDGKIVAAGTTNGGVFSPITNFGVARYMADGSFGCQRQHRMVTTDFGVATKPWRCHPAQWQHVVVASAVTRGPGAMLLRSVYPLTCIGPDVRNWGGLF
jgi:uncharacterized delta-60 repeat protein